MIIFLFLLALVLLLVILYIRSGIMGKAPDKKRRKIYEHYPNYSKGKFQNLSHTPDFVEGYSMTRVLYEYLFRKVPRQRPKDIVPSVKNNLHTIDWDNHCIVWFGHSSYFLQLDGMTFLVDPVFSGNASPLPGTNRSFKGTDIYSVDDMPYIDVLLLTHDHYDHLDHKTIVSLLPKIGKVVCGLGVGSHLEYWGYSPEMIIEKNWYEHVDIAEGFTVFCEPARHFSGRGFSRNTTLWVSFIVQSPSMKIYIGGDSGYDTHYKKIAEKHESFDLAILDNGQYDKAWQYIHHLPEEVIQVAKELHAQRVFPVHSCKFVMANHSWDEPLAVITELAMQENIPLITPRIGEIVSLTTKEQVFTQWWKDIE